MFILVLGLKCGASDVAPSPPGSLVVNTDFSAALEALRSNGTTFVGRLGWTRCWNLP